MDLSGARDSSATIRSHLLFPLSSMMGEEGLCLLRDDRQLSIIRLCWGLSICVV